MKIPGYIEVSHDDAMDDMVIDGEFNYPQVRGRWYIGTPEPLVDAWVEALRVVWRTYGDTTPSGRDAHDVLDSWGLIEKKP